jgi:hypothetical protein
MMTDGQSQRPAQQLAKLVTTWRISVGKHRCLCVHVCVIGVGGFEIKQCVRTEDKNKTHVTGYSKNR